jgi:hypothetical protein
MRPMAVPIPEVAGCASLRLMRDIRSQAREPSNYLGHGWAYPTTNYPTHTPIPINEFYWET